MCYVDWEVCKRSNNIFTATDVWEFTEVAEIFYSYSTCNSSNIDWNDFVSTESIKDKTIHVTIPSIFYPAHYKLNVSDGNDDTGNRFEYGQGDAYLDDSIPWKVRNNTCFLLPSLILFLIHTHTHTHTHYLHSYMLSSTQIT